MPWGTRYLHARVVPELDRHGDVASILVMERNITVLKTAQFALEDLTLQDPLTGLANRRYLDLFIEREWRREARHKHSVALIMVDIDYFKAYNDHYGHLHGDVCLQQVAHTLKGLLRRPNDFIARYGGEEFTAVLLELDLPAAERLAETMRRSIEQQHLPHPASGVASVVTISLGVAAAPAHLVGFAELLKIADGALYRAKKKGRNRVETALPSPS